jgi:hypothetical protein
MIYDAPVGERVTLIGVVDALVGEHAAFIGAVVCVCFFFKKKLKTSLSMTHCHLYF